MAAPLRTPARGPSRMAVPFPDEQRPTKQLPATKDGPDEPAPTEAGPSGPDNNDHGEEGEFDAYSRSRSSARAPRPITLSGSAGTAANVLLGALLWGWFLRPYLHGGTAEVKNVLRAKFLNQGPDGRPLP